MNQIIKFYKMAISLCIQRINQYYFLLSLGKALRHMHANLKSAVLHHGSPFVPHPFQPTGCKHLAVDVIALKLPRGKRQKHFLTKQGRELTCQIYHEVGTV